jgi:hypothetical protein
LKPERWGSPLVQEKYQEEKTCDKRLIIIIIIITTIIIIIIYLAANGLSPGGSGYNTCT